MPPTGEVVNVIPVNGLWYNLQVQARNQPDQKIWGSYIALRLPFGNGVKVAFWMSRMIELDSR